MAVCPYQRGCYPTGEGRCGRHPHFPSGRCHVRRSVASWSAGKPDESGRADAFGSERNTLRAGDHSSGGKYRSFPDRKSIVSGKSVSVRVDLGGLRNIKKKKNNK